MDKDTANNLEQAETTLGAYRDRDEQLRELLSYCLTNALDHPDHEAYEDIAGKLRTILDGER